MLKELRDARLRDGAAATTLSTATGDELLQEIWLERRKELWGEGFALTDIIRNQQSVERQTYTVYAKMNEDGTPMIDDEGYPVPLDEGTDTKEGYLLQGHSTVKFPDGSDFSVNSKYYLFRIVEQEELQNANLYSNHAKLDIYR